MTFSLKKYQSEFLGALVCLSLGMFSGFFSTPADFIWYASLKKPYFCPPNWIFAPVWTILYILMGIALGKLWNQKSKHKNLLIMFFVQFIINIFWYPLFFYMHNIQLAFYNIICLWFSLLACLIMARNMRTVFLLLLPYLLWVSFACILHYSIYIMNIK